jgi:hypothetical protein
MVTEQGMRSPREFYTDAVTVALDVAKRFSELRDPHIPGTKLLIQDARQSARLLTVLADELVQCTSLSARTALLRGRMRECIELNRTTYAALYAVIEIKAAMDEWLLPMLHANPDAQSDAELCVLETYRAGAHYVAMEALWIHQWMPKVVNPHFAEVYKTIFQTAVAGWKDASDEHATEIFDRLLQILQERGKQSEALIKIFRTTGAGASEKRYEQAMKQVYTARNKFTDDKVFTTTYMVLAHAWLNVIGVEEVHGIITYENPES